MGVGAQAGACHYGPFMLKADCSEFVCDFVSGLDCAYDAEIAVEDMLAKSPTAVVIIIAENRRDADDVPKKLRKAMRLLALSKKALCSILDISRPALYSWLDSSLEPGGLDLEKIDALSSLVEKSGISEPLFRGYVETPIGGFSSSIADCLARKEYLDEASNLPEMLRAAETLTLERKRIIAAHRIEESNLSEAEKDLILEDNLNCL